MQLVDNDVNITDLKGNSLLYHSIQSSNEEVINYILQCPKFDSNKSDILTSFISSYKINLNQKVPIIVKEKKMNLGFNHS